VRLPVRPRRRGPRLAGRGAELARLDGELSRCRGGELRCVLIFGEPGVGKTRLAEELLHRHADTCHGISARAYPLGTAAPFSLWVDAFEPALAVLEPVEVAALCDGFTDDLATLLHGVAPAGAGAGGERSRHRLVEGLARILDGFARARPLIAVLDDVHLADPSSWDVLRHTARRFPDRPLLLVATARQMELRGNEVAGRVLFELEQDDALTRLELGPLQRAGVAELAEALIDRPPPAELVDWLASRSRGNALYAVGLLRALLEEGADLSAPRLRRLPESLTERVTGRVRGLGDADRATLELLAVLGRPVELGELVRLTDRPLEDLAGTLAALHAARAVTEEERGREIDYQIHHPVVRDAIYQGIGAARRRVVHREVAEALRRAGRTGEAARHFARSAEVGDTEAIAVLREAVRQAEDREAYREALELLGELVELLPDGDPGWLDVVDALSWGAEWVVDHRADVHAQLGIRAMRTLDALLAGSSDLHRTAAVKFRLASFLAWGALELDEAETAFGQAADLFEQAGDRRQALLAARERAWTRGLRGDFSAMEAEATQIVAAAEVLGDRFVIMQALAAAGFAATFAGRLTTAERWLARAAAIAREDAKLYRLTALQSISAVCLTLQGRVRETEALFREARTRDVEFRETLLLEIEAYAGWMAGDYRASVASARESIAWNPAGTSWRRSWGSAYGALSALEVGDVTEARQLLARSAQALSDRDPRIYAQHLHQHAEGVLAWHDGRRGDALLALRRAGSALLAGRNLAYAATVLLDLAELESECGEHDSVARTASSLTDIAARCDSTLFRGFAPLATAWAELAAGRHSAAAAQARSAVELLTPTGCRGFLARAELALGRAVAVADRNAGVTAFQHAADLFDAAAALVRRDRALDELRALGSPGRRAADASLGPASLTAREREVARLAADGLTAREIAGRLFVGERTVETHLTRVYAKLGVRTKVELMRRAGELPF
jgi:DNA-binding CsgD family transcriptional regulator